MILSIYQISKAHGSANIKKHCVMGGRLEELNNVSKREILRFKREKVTFN